MEDNDDEYQGHDSRDKFWSPESNDQDKIQKRDDWQISRNGDKSCENQNRDSQRKRKRGSGKTYAPNRRLPNCPFSKEALLSVARNAFAYHRFEEARILTSVLALDIRTPHYFLLKAALILVGQQGNKTELFMQLMNKITQLDLNKREVMLNIILHFIRNKQLSQAKSYIESHKYFLDKKCFRSHKLIDPLVKAYAFYVDYLEWKKEGADSSSNFYTFLNDRRDEMGDKIIYTLKDIASNTKDCHLDVFMIILLEILERYNRFDDVQEILQCYARNNPENLNAHIYLYLLCQKYPEKIFDKEPLLIASLKNIARLCPSHELVLELVENDFLPSKENVELLFDFMDYNQNSNNLRAWKLLNRVISESSERANDLKDLWFDYKNDWISFHFRTSKEEDFLNSELHFYKKAVLSFFEDNGKSDFLAKTEKMHIV